MATEKLKDALDALHQELESGGEISAEDRAALLQAARDIEAALSEGADEERSQPLNERIAESVRDFEKSHPRFAEILENLSEALANMGI